MMQSISPWLGLVGLIGLLGLIAIWMPVERGRPGGLVRLMGLMGFLGLLGFWIPGSGAFGAAGALSLWNHQNTKLAFCGWLGWSCVTAVPFLIIHGVR